MPWAAIFSLLSGIPGMIGGYFKKKQEIEELRLQNQLAIQLEQQKQIGQLAEQDSQRAALMIGATGMNFKYVVFGIFSIPFLAALTGNTEYVKHVFDNINTLPQEYRIMYYSLVGLIFGVPVPGNVMSMVVEGVKTAVANRRQYSLDKIDKKAYFESLRKIKGPISEADVKLQDAVLNDLNRK